MVEGLSPPALFYRYLPPDNHLGRLSPLTLISTISLENLSDFNSIKDWIEVFLFITAALNVSVINILLKMQDFTPQ